MTETRSTPNPATWMVMVSVSAAVLLGATRSHLRASDDLDQDPGAATSGAEIAASDARVTPRTRPADRSALERRVRELEAAQCPEMRASDDGVDVMTSVVSDTLAFALITTPCHERGAYNYAYAIYVEERGRVRPATIARAPARLRFPAAHHRRLRLEDARAVWNPSIATSPHGVVLSTISLHRGLGDSADGVEYVWRDGRFTPTTIRVRAGGAYAPAENGELPVVAPASRRCDGELRVSTAGETATLTTYAKGRTRVRTFVLEDALCVARPHTIACGEDRMAPVAEYGLVSSDHDWVVLRMTRDGEREVFRATRGCAL